MIEIISIHASREGGDVNTSDGANADVISIHASREGGDRIKLIRLCNIYISIHASREGGDTSGQRFSKSFVGFQSTPPVREATRENRNAHAG